MDKNTITCFSLIFLVLIGFWWINKPTEEQMAARQRYLDSVRNAQVELLQQEADVRQQEIKPLYEESDSDSLKMAKLEGRYGEFAKATMGEQQVITLSNELMKLELSSKGAAPKKATLSNYNNYQGTNVVLFQEEDNQFDMELQTKSGVTVHSRDLLFQVVSKNDTSVVFSAPAGENSSLEVIYRLPRNSYMLDFDVKQNGLRVLSSDSLNLSWKMNLAQQEKGRKFESRYAQLYYFSNEDGYEYLSETSNDELSAEYPLRWVAFKDQFFSNVLIADGEMTQAHLKSTLANDSSAYLKHYQASMTVPMKEGLAEMHYYFGPNDYNILRSYNSDDHFSKDEDIKLNRLVPMGFAILRWINQILYIPMFRLFGSFLSNYGLIILLMTIVVKLIVFPFTYKSYLSQANMRVLKPQIDEINKRIPAENQMERSRETMDLYSKAGVNPMGGCLPMFLQMPFLIALFYFFPNAIELRGQSFLWANDLSTYDAIVSWDAQIPLVSYFFGNHISLFCLLMTITNIVYTKVNMQMSDSTGQMDAMPVMKYMMYFMPIMFLFIFNEYASGLTYYYFVSLLITIVQTWFIRKYMVNEEQLLQKIKARQSQPTMKKSTWLSRIEEMQRQMEEQQKAQQKKDK